MTPAEVDLGPLPGHCPRMPAARRLGSLVSALLICAVATAADAGALRECMQGCRVVQGGCVDDVQAAYSSARAECETTGGGRSCTRDAKLTRKTADHACRKYTKTT